MIRTALVLVALLAAIDARPAPRRRALLIGINDYSASRLGGPRHAAPNRDWPNLSGAVNDVRLLQEMLVLLYGFERRDIVTLTDQAATRAAILQTLDKHLVQSAAKGDVVFFYYAGHGSQVRNSLSDERDRLDESIVPADSRAGAADIRDKELRRAFNRILDRGAQLTVLMDNCHSGSGARGLPTGARPRGIAPDLRDVRDRTSYGARPEDRGALVLAATQDRDDAWEIRDDEGRMHGAFSWAFIRAMRDSVAGESAAETFARAAARMRAEKPYQAPVLAGTPAARSRPFLRARGDHRGGRLVVAVRDVRKDGTVLLHGGWANGLAAGSELRAIGKDAARVIVTTVHGLSSSEGRLQSGTVSSGSLMEIAGWAAPPARPLRVWMPRAAGDVRPLAARLFTEATKRRIRWTTDPTESTPSYLLRRGPRTWELLARGGRVESVADPVAALKRVPAGASLFVQLPSPALSVGAEDGVQTVARAEEADYILAGRYAQGRVAYAWVRPHARRADQRRTGLPVRTAWVADAATLHEAVLRLRRIHAWQRLESPPASPYPYTLALRRVRDGQLAQDVVTGAETYDLLLRAGGKLAARVAPRYVYIFVIDSDGNSILLFPAGGTGSVENRFPPAPPPAQILLGEAGRLEVMPPYGIDTYFLLTTDEPLPNPWILQWDGVRGGEAYVPRTALEELLLATGSGSRSARRATPSNWSLQRYFLEAVAPGGRK